jgi:nucleotide-binding universal stress UspA family protein
MFRNILVALDGSETAQRALGEAIELAEALNARLTIISVVPPMPGYAYRAGIDLEALGDEAEAETEKLLREGVDRVPDAVSVTTVLKRGHAGEEIVKQIDEGEHDLLVMGSRGLGRVTANLFGSVAAYVHFHHGHITMLVVHPERRDS